jgi:predicted HTH transcriptional regulator
MNNPEYKNSQAKLSEARFSECLKIVVAYLKDKPSVRNRDIRQAAGITYDQAIHFFNQAISENLLLRQGSGSSTCYVLKKAKDKSR